MPRNLRQGLDRDVYAVLKKFEGADEGSLNTISKVYEAIQSSNSHLRRQKKKPLEDSIYRVLEFRKEELQELDDDSDAAIEAAEAQRLPKKPEDERFLLNRQMTKHWHTDKPTAPSATENKTGAPASDKTAVASSESDKKVSSSLGTSDGSHTKKRRLDEGDGNMSEKAAKVPKKAIKARPEVERPIAGQRRLGGLKDSEDELFEILRNSLTRTYGQDGGSPERPSGILLSGPMGVGKKSLVRSVAAKLEVPIVSMGTSLGDVERMEKTVVEAMDEAMRLAPSIILVEDVDEYMGASDEAPHKMQVKKVVEFFEKQRLKMLEELSADRHVFVIGTTTNLDNVHLRLIYDGPFIKKFHIKVPDLAAREDIFRAVLERVRVSDSVNMTDLAKMTHGFVGMDIKTLVSEALLNKYVRVPVEAGQLSAMESPEEPDATKVDALTMEDIQSALKGYVPSLRKEGFTEVPNVTWEQVGAMAAVRRHLHSNIVGPIKNPDLWATWGLSRPSGVILWGPPGCGKTLVAQAVANEAQASFILISGPELLNKYVGESERAVRELFQRARSSTPCILFFDEMDSLVPRRDGASSDAGVRVVNTLLAELDGVRDRTGIYVMGTTNRPDMIDSAMMRPGRLSVRLFVDLPTENERVDILKTIFRNARPNASEAELGRLERVARDPRCRDFSGADLAGLQVKAGQVGIEKWLDGRKTVAEVDESDWDEALATTSRSVKDPAGYRALEADMKAGTS